MADSTADTRHDLPHAAEGLKSDPDRAEDISVEKTSDFGPAPDGGTRAWLVAVGAHFVLFACLGYANSFGVFQEYYLHNQLSGETPDKIAWIGSLVPFLQLAMGVFSGPAFDRYGAWILRPGVIMYVFAIMMTSLCKKYWQFMLAQAILMGLATGFTILPALAAVSQFFDKRRAAALGIAVSGSSIGGIVFPIVLSKLLNDSSLGFGWSVRIMGFAMLPFLLFSCVVIEARLPPNPTAFLLPRAFLQARFSLLVAAMFFMTMGMWTPLFYIPTFAVARGMDATLASYMLAILNASSFFGRVIPGVLADKFGRINIFAVGGVATGIVVACLTRVESTAGLVVYSIFVGLTSGTIISGASAAFSVCPENVQELGTYMGMGLGVSSFAALIGPPITGKFVDTYGGFFEASIFSGMVCIVGGFIAFAAKATNPQGLWGNI